MKKPEVYVRRDVIFNEKDFGHTRDVQQLSETTEVDIKSGTEAESAPPPEDNTEQVEQQNLRRSDRQRQSTIRFGIDEYADTAVPSSTPEHMAYAACQIVEPLTMKEAMNSDQSNEWKEAADAECDSILHNETWDLVKLPPGRKP